MSDTTEILFHRLFYEPAAYFVRDSALTEADFAAVSELLAIRAHSTQGSQAHHWAGLKSRATGRCPWDAVMPPYMTDGAPDVDEQRRRLQTVANVAAKREYACWVVDGLTMTIDLFNPGNELQLDYANAGETVVALLFTPARGPAEQNVFRGVPRPSFFELLEEIANVLQPKQLIVAGRLHSNMRAILDGRMSRDRSPWSLLHPGTVVNRPGLEKVEVLRDLCAMVRPWREDQLFVQVSKGYGGGMDREFDQVGQLLGLIPWTRYVEGADPKPKSRTRTERDEYPWPTDVRANGTSPTSVELVSSGNLHWTRQGLYQMQAAAALQDRGHEIRAFQGALVGAQTRITIPLVIVGAPIDACSYTESEAWSSERIDKLTDWLRELRKESDSKVIVVAREESDVVAALPEVSEFIVLPYDNLPT